MRKLTLLGLLTALMLATGAPAASAETFHGECDMNGTVEPTEPYTFIPRPMDSEVFARGTCTGVLDGRPYDGPAHIYVDGRMNQPMSCGLLVAKDVPGKLTFGPDENAVFAPRVDFFAGEAVEVAAQMPGHIRGAFNGHAAILIQVQAGEQTVRDCAGPGLWDSPLTLHLHTLTPLYG